jgi:hypothetical protein
MFQSVGRLLSARRTILDDRGQVREVRHADYEIDLEEEAEVRAAAVEAARSGSHGSAKSIAEIAWAILLIGGSIAALGSAIIWVLWGVAGAIAPTLGLTGRLGQLALLLAISGAILAMSFAVRVHRAARSRRRTQDGERTQADEHGIRVRVGRSGVCFCCDYDLKPLPREPDGCVVCTECGAAWRIDDWAADGGCYRLPHDQAGQKPESGFLGRNAWVRDARGVIVPVLAGVSPKKRARAMIDRAGPAAARRNTSHVIFFASLAAAVLAAAALWTFYEPLGGMLLAAVLTPSLGLVWFVQRRRAIDRCCAAIRVAALADHRCPCCESPLRPTPSPIDACRLCDTCGSAWEPPKT